MRVALTSKLSSTGFSFNGEPNENSVLRVIKRFLGGERLGAVVVAVIAAVLGVSLYAPWDAIFFQHKRYSRAAIGSNRRECAEIGRNILENGGSAVDAAIATLLCEGGVSAQCGGLGGGFIATVYERTTGQVRVLNARERAPAATTANMYNNASSTVGGLAAAVPGELRGYGELHRQYGRLPWKELVTPTVELCVSGFLVDQYLSDAIKADAKEINADPSMRDVYINPATGRLYELGNTLVLPKLAETMAIIAEEGPETLHNGSLTASFVRDIKESGGIITADDMRNFRLEWQEPIESRLNADNMLYTAPLPASGPVLVFMLNMQNGWVSDDLSPPESDLYWHRIIETFKHAYAKRTELGDPSRTDLPRSIKEVERNITNPEWAVMHRLQVDDTRTFTEYQHYGARSGNAVDHGTTHVVVIAPDGSVVSVSSTINHPWGCKRISRSTGIVLNNEMDDFDIPGRLTMHEMPPSPANMLAPGLNPLSSVVPSLVLNKAGDAVLVLGGAGGIMVPAQICLIVQHIIVEGSNDLCSAMYRPRLHHLHMPNEVIYEEHFDENILNSLRQRGHSVGPVSTGAGFGALVAAARDKKGYLIPVSDKRRPGIVTGF